jgi:parallel beta-helix repeat protein
MKRLLALMMLLAALTGRAATTITVTNLADFDPGSLYQAIFDANTSSPPVRIAFNYPGTGPFIIRYTNAFLPYLTNQVSIDGASQPGYANQPLVWIDGSGVTSPANFGILVQGGNSTLRALRVHGFTSTGIILGGAEGGNEVVGCWVLSNQQGIVVNNSSNTLGGLSPSNRNVVSGNAYSGIRLSGPSWGNRILGNYVGLNPTNTSMGMTNGEHGIHIVDAAETLMAGVSTARQVIAASGQDGIHITGTEAYGNVVVGSYIGVDTTGGNALSNGQNGVYIWQAHDNRIGGTNSSDGNIISGNGGHGVSISGASASNNAVQGNRIGTTPVAITAVRNFGRGVQVSDGPGTSIGGSASGTGNIIVGNRLEGISLFGDGGNIRVQGNAIGVNASGTIISNGGSGIYVSGAPGTLIGGSNTFERNVICGNNGEGIYLAAASNVTVQGNFIGVSAGGLRRPNANNGIECYIARDCTIGGTNAGARNVISGNNFNGVRINSDSQRNTVLGNYIGLNDTGSAEITNSAYGIRIYQATNNTIGGSAPGSRNVIAGNPSGQILVENGSVSNAILGNFVGVAADGVTPVPGGLGTAGIVVNAPYTRIGGSTANERNVIAGNAEYGIYVYGCSNTTIQGNYINLTSNGLAVLTNSDSGVYLDAGAVHTLIGGTNSGEGNAVGSGYYGIYVRDCYSNTIAGNYIGLAATGTNAITNVLYSIWMQGAKYNTIGGTNAGARNAIFGKTVGLTLFTTGTHHNAVLGNYINLGAAGTIISSNCGSGFSISDSPSNTIGGAAEGAGNVVACNGNGIYMSGSNSVANMIQGNYIGVGPDGVSSRGLTNVAGAGILIQFAPRNVIGGTNAGEGNIIARMMSGGISIFGTNAAGNAILGNTLYSNRQSGGFAPAIDLNGDNTVNANDASPDADNGANRLQNFPTITTALTFQGSTLVTGYLASAGSQTFRLEFFASDVNFQEGRYFLGWTNVTTAALGTGSFRAVLSGYAGTSRWITATATDSSNNTSEFSTPFKPVLATDTDNDKMPDFWESQYGLNPAVSNLVTSDADADGASDYAEYLAATIPNNAASILEVGEVVPGTNATITFATTPYRTYSLEAGTNLLGTTWRVIVTNALGNGNDKTVTDRFPTSGISYRVRATIP